MKVCILDDCGVIRYKGGYCQPHARQLGVIKPLAPCGYEGCPRKGRTSREGSMCAKHSGERVEDDGLCGRFRCGNKRAEGRSVCARHAPKAPTCATHGCSEPRHEEHGQCRRHYLRGLDSNVACVIPGCGSCRWRARLCGRHAGMFRDELVHCGFPSCEAWVWRDTVCAVHADIGLDFAAGDWFDWVAVDQMFRGQHDRSRRPTALEVLALIEKADRAELQYADLARRLGVEPQKLERWRYHSARLAATFEAAA